ncbi:uncharacterized protein HMPREF1541_02034 [Cyphellophora europaea CBS 101466]|uniref:Peptidase C14 caspase domain-containing protein n=1 Tax=Cyphellophora europaea (strain CBS 101466) TaxID=1220924 RepID=W2S2G1_CYPE1|nr:uncharacterized protein HMPREF1541_02034 [Cyphellophora europaea CBS 101466]ETN42876.1 hypothetical protein HMPREF1541_02034 [Cyphellophora europaea CBS 101466]
MTFPPYQPFDQGDVYPSNQMPYLPFTLPQQSYQPPFQQISAFSSQQHSTYPQQYFVEQHSPTYTTPAYTPGPHIMQHLSPAPSHSAYSPSTPPNLTLPSVGRAVVIGINYFNQKGEMRGRVDEARNLSRYLQQVKRYRKEDIILLTDDQNGPFGQPTKKNVLGALFWLAKNAQQGEKLVIYYSGHGSVSINKKKAKGKKPSRSSPATADEEMETIYPVDFRSFKEGMIKPSELQEILKPANDKGAKLTIILDAHTGMK